MTFEARIGGKPGRMVQGGLRTAIPDGESVCQLSGTVDEVLLTQNFRLEDSATLLPVLHDLNLWWIPELSWPVHLSMLGNFTRPSEQLPLWAKLAALENASAHCVTPALSFSSHICHCPALHVMSHIPDSWHHPQKCALSRIDVPYLWTQPHLLYMLPGAGMRPRGLLGKPFQSSAWPTFPAQSFWCM